MSMLENINTPADLKEVPEDKLVEVCREVRQKIIDDCAENPGHLGASLGTVELTVALHYVFNTPYDNVIWDVGHQSYAHKILTERKEQFKTKRLYGGISGFPRRSESEYDSFGTGHSSTSISAALGMAVAAAKAMAPGSVTPSAGFMSCRISSVNSCISLFSFPPFARKPPAHYKRNSRGF